MDPFETFDATLYPHRVLVAPADTARPYVEVDLETDLLLLRYLLASADMDTSGAALLRGHALTWPGVHLQEVEADTHSIVVDRVLTALEGGSLIAAVADLEELSRPVRLQDLRGVGGSETVTPSGRPSGGLSPVYRDKLLVALERLPDAVSGRISTRAGAQLAPYFEGPACNSTAGIFVLWAGDAAPGSDFVVDGRLLGVGHAFAGANLWLAFDHVQSFFKALEDARLDLHIDTANRHLAEAIRILGVNGFLSILRNVTPRKEDGAATGTDEGAPKKASAVTGGGSAGGTPLEQRTAAAAKPGGGGPGAAGKGAGKTQEDPAPAATSGGAAAAEKDDGPKQCTDDSGATCDCAKMTKITLYVQKGQSPASVVASHLWDKATGTSKMDTGHTFLGLGDGKLSAQRAYGFYPAESWFGETGGFNTNDGFYLPGQDAPTEDYYSPENEHAYTHSQDFKACPQQVEALEAAILADIEKVKTDASDAPKYDLRGLQCTTWAEEKLSSLGFAAPDSMSPHGAAGDIEEAAEEKRKKSNKKGGDGQGKK